MRKDKVVAIVLLVLVVLIVGVLIFAVKEGGPTYSGGSTQAVFANVSEYMQYSNGTDYGVVMVFSLSNCVYCQKTKAWLDNHNVGYYWVDVDFADANELQAIFGPGGIPLACGTPSGFPVILTGNTCIVGYDEPSLMRIAGVK